MTGDLTTLLHLALRAVDHAQDHLRRHRPDHVTAKADRDMVTNVDLAIERRTRMFLHRHSPQIGFLGEEEGGATSTDTTLWMMDPVDGTANYVRGLPFCGISLALIDHQRPVLGVLALPFLDRLYWATEHTAAFCNGQQITAAATTQLAQALVAVGDYGTGPDAQQRNDSALALHAYLAARVQRVRMLGSAAADLAFVADGTLDASITLSNRTWDMAAGTIIARQAGAAVTDTDGTAHTITSRATIATTPGLREDILTAVNAATESRGTPC